MLEAGCDMSGSGADSTLGKLLKRAAGFDRVVRFVGRGDGETAYSYEDVYLRAAEVAAGLERCGVRRGDRIGVNLPTSIEFYDAFFGISLAGAIPVPFYPPVRLGRLDEYHARTAAMLQVSEARLVLTDRRVRRLLGKTVERADLELGCLTTEEVAGGRQGASLHRESSPQDLALIQFSSGATGAPKAVCLTHRQVLSNVRAILRVIMGAYPETSGLQHSGVCWLPLYHDMGLIGCVFTALMHPGDLTLIPPELFVARPGTWFRAISRHRATVSPAPNFAYSLCVERIGDAELEGVDLSSWRLALNGGEPVMASVLERFRTRFRRWGFREEALTPVYGLAEAALAVTFSDPSRQYGVCCFDPEGLAAEGVARPAREGKALVSVGKPLPGYEVRVVEEHGRDVAPTRVGRILVRGPSVMQGYLGLADENGRVLHEGWLDTGDTGFFHEGELFIYGRAKDLIVLRGCNYAPQDIEQTLGALEGVRQGCCAAVGLVPEGGAGEELFVFVERSRTRGPGGDARLAQAVARRIAECTGLTGKVLILEPGTLPRTSSGKIRRGETRERYFAGKLLPPKAVTAWSLASEMIRSKVALARS
ncbi:MAG: fatty acyl-AMP ligase, partial [Acidobacteriota bacterium]